MTDYTLSCYGDGVQALRTETLQAPSWRAAEDVARRRLAGSRFKKAVVKGDGGVVIRLGQREIATYW